MSGRPHNPEEDRVHIGEAVLDARSQGVNWKVLERTFGRGRRQLYRYALAVASGSVPGEMTQDTSEMTHLGD